MPNDVFDFRTDVKVEFLIPTSGNWIWGVSQWDSGDVWGGSTSSETWTDLACESSIIEIDRGCTVDSGIFVRPAESRAKIVLQTPEYDPFTHGTIRTGTLVRIRILPLPDSDPVVDDLLYTGQVQSFKSSYDARGNNLVTLECVDALQAFLNTKVATYTIAALSKYPNDVLTDLCNSYWNTSFFGAFNPDIYYMAAQTYTNVTVGDIVNDCLVAGLGALYTTPDGDLNYRSEEDLQNILESVYSYDFSTIHSTGPTHICMSELEMAADSRNLPNEIIASYTGGGLLALRNQDAYDLYGAISLQVDLPIDDSTGTQLWLNRLNLTTKLRRVESLTFQGVARDGLVRDWSNVDHLFDPQIVSYTLGGLSFTDKYFVTRQRDVITPVSWDITLELWRGI